MKAKHTDLEKLEQLYKESSNQLVVLYGRRGCQKEEIIVAQSEPALQSYVVRDPRFKLINMNEL